MISSVTKNAIQEVQEVKIFDRILAIFNLLKATNRKSFQVVKTVSVKSFDELF